MAQASECLAGRLLFVEGRADRLLKRVGRVKVGQSERFEGFVATGAYEQHRLTSRHVLRC